ncbi:unnamed protein product (macronuclear) [Paramecium tetraurelia]|uniref:Transmembrane protein n=1 Tax=Paramecium tetraurelia TaxID=5888 RepID=A0CT33_PARTE|nr:uncharacterized protein GSPATT00010183001 [Paramecium tetraurelia]CAK73950.1 unnamed protein product [Paramecium tetraurelia]|eukprot:XP_001441347.1 hypothetical protein (macronuclear) [Paramecium tetraurelia strain d4-2]
MLVLQYQVYLNIVPPHLFEIMKQACLFHQLKMFLQISINQSIEYHDKFPLQRCLLQLYLLNEIRKIQVDIQFIILKVLSFNFLIKMQVQILFILMHIQQQTWLPQVLKNSILYEIQIHYLNQTHISQLRLKVIDYCYLTIFLFNVNPQSEVTHNVPDEDGITVAIGSY